jgi:hypothetical protein
MKKLDEQERQAAEVIAVEMADKNRVQTARVVARALHGQQGRRAAVQEKKSVFGLEEISALVAPAAAKGVAATEYVKFHGAARCIPFALGSILEFPRRPILAPPGMRRYRPFDASPGLGRGRLLRIPPHGRTGRCHELARGAPQADDDKGENPSCFLAPL